MRSTIPLLTLREPALVKAPPPSLEEHRNKCFRFNSFGYFIITDLFHILRFVSVVGSRCRESNVNYQDRQESRFAERKRCFCLRNSRLLMQHRKIRHLSTPVAFTDLITVNDSANKTETESRCVRAAKFSEHFPEI